MGERGALECHPRASLPESQSRPMFGSICGPVHESESAAFIAVRHVLYHAPQPHPADNSVHLERSKEGVRHRKPDSRENT